MSTNHLDHIQEDHFEAKHYAKAHGERVTCRELLHGLVEEPAKVMKQHFFLSLNYAPFYSRARTCDYRQLLEDELPKRSNTS